MSAGSGRAASVLQAAGALALGAALWWAAPMLLDVAGLSVAGLLGSVAVVILGLTVAELAWQRTRDH
jgi:hypothetical protein